MNFREFELHRPRLARQLVDLIVSSWESVDESRLSVDPRYVDGIRFVAWINGEQLVCFAPGHPLFNEADDGPGCCGTWWWSYDVPDLPADHKF